MSATQNISLKTDATKPITDEDIRVLVQHPDAERRAVVAQKVCRRVRDHDLSKGERRIANEILGFIAEDAASLVRRALAITLKNSPEDSRAVATLAANDGADISAELAAHMLDSYRDDDLIAQAFIRRRDLPFGIAEKLVAQLSAEAAIELTRRHAVPVGLAIELASRARERATIDIIDQSTKTRDVALLVARLAQEGRLTESLIIRAAGCGEMRFVEHALAVKAGISHAKSALMVHDNGPFSPRPWSGSKSSVSDVSISCSTATRVISRYSMLSAVALTGRFSGFKTSKTTLASAFTSAPLQRRGRKALIGVSAKISDVSGSTGPWADKL